MADRSDKTVLVTGANSGIGLATVLAAAAAGFRTVGTARSPDKAEVIAGAAQNAGVEVETQLLDVTDAAGCERVVDAVGPVYGLVNNAGYGLTGAIEDVDDDEARQLLETMVMAPMRLARLVLPGMREVGGGRIVNISSIYGRTSTPLTGWYQGAKHAIEALSDALRIEVARDGVHVALIEPGGFKTNIWEDLERDLAKRRDSAYERAYQRLGSLMQASSAVMGEPADCAKVVVTALTSSMPRARYLVGLDARFLATADQFTPTVVKDRVMRILQGL